MPLIAISNPALAGQTVWVRLWEFGGDFEGTFDVCATGNTGICIPTTSDCAGAIPLCSDSPVSNLASGQGCVADLNSNNDGCLSGEHNTSWFLVQISTSGTWGWDGVFNVSSNGIEYDWALWQISGNPLTNPSICGNLNQPIRCSYASQAGKSEVSMGMNSTDPDIFEGSSPSGNGYTQWLTNAQAGEYYLLMIDRWSTGGGSFTLDFTGTATMNCDITIPLPIELMSFSGKNISDYNQLNWITATENNNDYFTLERSDDGHEWIEIDRINGVGNSTTLTSYSYQDYDYVNNKINYYRLSQTDFDGTRETFDIVSINNINEFDEISYVKVYDLLGRECNDMIAGGVYFIVTFYVSGRVESNLIRK
jgi:hypothetical protein